MSRSCLETGSIATTSDGAGNSRAGQLQPLLARRERVAGLGHGELGDRADLAGLEFADRFLFLAVQQQQLADALVLVAGRVPDVGLRLERARHDAQVGQPADERIGRGLEHADEQRAVLVRGDLHGRTALVGRPGRRFVGGGGEIADDRVEQAAQLDALGRRSDEDRRQDAVLHALAEAQLQLVVGDVLALEVLGQHLVVGLGGGFEELVAPAGDLVGHVVGDRDLDLVVAVPAIGLAVDEIDVAAERLAGADGQLDRGDLVPERGAERVERDGRIGVLAVALVDEEAGRGVRRPRERDGLLEAGLDATGGVHDQERAVGSGEALDDVGDEVRVAGRVDQGDPGPVVLERPDREAQRFLALLLLGFEVEVGGPVIDLAQAWDGPGLEHELLRERRLAGAGMAGQDDAAKVG